jgi:hypothetical protein
VAVKQPVLLLGSLHPRTARQPVARGYRPMSSGKERVSKSKKTNVLLSIVGRLCSQAPRGYNYWVTKTTLVCDRAAAANAN